MSAHAEFLRAASKDDELAARLKDDYRTASLTGEDRLMLEFVEKLTLYPWLMVRTDVVTLRNAGFRDSTILHIVLGSAHFNYLNRMADGIGIRFEYESLVGGKGYSSPTPAAAPQVDLPKPQPASSAWIESPESHETESEEGPKNLYRLMSYNPDARDLARAWRNYHLTGTERLSARLRCNLGLYISYLNHCEYSAYWLVQYLKELGDAPSLSEQLSSGTLPADLPIRERCLFAHARRLTQEPASTKEEHIHQLRHSGCDDEGILQLTMLCSYFSFENRVALGLGIPIEGEPLS